MALHRIINTEVVNDRLLYLNEPKMALDFLVRNLGFVIHVHTDPQKTDIVKICDCSGNVYEVSLRAVTNENRAVSKPTIHIGDCLQEYYQMELKGIIIITKPYYVPEGLAFEISDYWNNRYTLMENRDYTEQ